MASNVWEFMLKNQPDNKESVQCSICKAIFSYKDGSTTSLRRHLTNQHKLEITSKRGSNQPSPSSHSQPKLKQFLKSKEKLKSESPRAQAITNKVVKMICKDLQPLAVIEDEGFKELVMELEPRYTFPSRARFRNIIMPTIYQKAVLNLKTIIEQYKINNPSACFSLTTDGWTSRNPISFVTYTLHFVIKDELQSYVLSTQELSEQHTAENLKTHIGKTLLEWGIVTPVGVAVDDQVDQNLDDLDDPEENASQDLLSSIPLRELKRIVFTTDNASNISKAVKDSGTSHVRCFAHTLNLGVQKFIASISDHLAKIRTLVKFFHRSPGAAAKLSVSLVGLYLIIITKLQDCDAYLC